MNAMSTPNAEWVTVEQLPYAEGQVMVTQTSADGAYRVFVVDTITKKDVRTGEVREY
jgi:hypothetical protein